MHEPKQQDAPLVVDLDGTLSLTDTLVESLLRLVKQSPLSILAIPLWLLRGRAYFKTRVAERVRLDAGTLPFNPDVVSYLITQKDTGRPIILATAAHESIAHSVATHLGLFSAVLATTEQKNLKGREKLISIKAQIGERFVYAGDSSADLPIWREASAAILVGTPPKITNALRLNTAIEQEIPLRNQGIRQWIKALRLYQWSKNLLLFTPLLVTFSFVDIHNVAKILLAFIAFSLAASANYIVNDLLDLESDRAHPRKKNRPFAAGTLKISHGLFVAAALLMLSMAIAAYVSAGFFMMLAGYLLLTSLYSWMLKELIIIDVLMLSLLYTWRVLAGSVALGIATSSWLLAFSAFLFLSLALIKRCAELVTLNEIGTAAASGRDYRVSDLTVLWPLGVGSAIAASLVFGLFISSVETQQQYASPHVLWGVAFCLIYWLARLWIKTTRGEMHDDPLIFALRDRGSRLTIAAMVFITLAAHFLHLEQLP